MQAITHHLVDCEGQTLAPQFEALRLACGDGLSETALIECTVNKLGYAHVQEGARGLVVSFSRAIITPVTLVGAIYLLADLQDKRAIFSTPPSYSLCSTRSQAIRRLMEEMGRIESAGLPTAFHPSGVTR